MEIKKSNMVSSTKKQKTVLITLPGMLFGGMERVAFIARKILMENGYNVKLLTLYNDNSDYEPEFNYVSLHCGISNSFVGKIFNSFLRILKLYKYKKKVKPDYVISFGQNSNFCNVFSKINEKLIVGIRSYDWLYNYFYNYKLEKFIYDKADLVVSVSKQIKKEAEEKFCICDKKSYVLYNPYDVDIINNSALDEITEIKIPKVKKIIVSVGRLENQKGFYHLIKSISLLKNRSNVICYIIGHGNYELQLLNLIKELKLEENVFLLGGQSNPYKFMKRADLYVMPSITEGFPNALVEAMCVGTPVLSSDCPSGPREILSDTFVKNMNTNDIEFVDYGVLVRPMTDSRLYTSKIIENCDFILANAIDRLITDDKLLKTYGEKAKIRAKVFSYKKFENTLMGLLLKS